MGMGARMRSLVFSTAVNHHWTARWMNSSHFVTSMTRCPAITALQSPTSLSKTEKRCPVPHEPLAEKDGFRVYLEQDEFAENPRKMFDHLGTMLYTSTRYVLGDENVSRDRMQEVMADPENIWIKVFAYIHSGTTLRAGGAEGAEGANPFTCQWDSGMCGVIYVTRKDALKDWTAHGKPQRTRMTQALRAKIIKNLVSEVEEFSRWCEGEVYSYHVEDQLGEIVDSCSGYYGYDDAKQEAMTALGNVVLHAAKDAAKQLTEAAHAPSLG